ncbi:ABC transporter substrate-binding protein [Microbacterium sp.]|uniref:ABC transporter substrate-binding protein n=1 Tax=Microbacterium sp. TaxID=51671 RepID=UPI0039E4DA0D
MSLRSLRWTAVTAVVAVLALGGCSATDTASPSGSADAGDGVFPVTFTHLYGQTTLDVAPERVATWGWGATDAVLALGVMPVAIPSDDYGGGETRITPWVQDAIDEVGGDAPVILDSSSYTLDVEALLATDPDVLIASYSGLTQEEYDAVTAAGIPVIAPETALWATPWRDVITDAGKALGLQDKADEVLAGLDGLVADAAAAHPEFAGTTIAFAADDVDTFYLYLPADARVEIFEDLGFVSDPSVEELDTGESTFYTTVSAENLDKITAEVIFSYGFVDDAALDTFLHSQRTNLIPAIAKGAVATISGVGDSDAVSPTALTLPYLLPTVVEKLAEATAVAKG